MRLLFIPFTRHILIALTIGWFALFGDLMLFTKIMGIAESSELIVISWVITGFAWIIGLAGVVVSILIAWIVFRFLEDRWGNMREDNSKEIEKILLSVSKDQKLPEEDKE